MTFSLFKISTSGKINGQSQKVQDLKRQNIKLRILILFFSLINFKKYPGMSGDVA